MSMLCHQERICHQPSCWQLFQLSTQSKVGYSDSLPTRIISQQRRLVRNMPLLNKFQCHLTLTPHITFQDASDFEVYDNHCNPQNIEMLKFIDQCTTDTVKGQKIVTFVSCPVVHTSRALNGQSPQHELTHVQQLSTDSSSRARLKAFSSHSTMRLLTALVNIKSIDSSSTEAQRFFSRYNRAERFIPTLLNYSRVPKHRLSPAVSCMGR